MIDIHTHILPGLDDGAPDWDQAIAMAKAAVAEGIETIIATPHHANGTYLNEAAVVKEAVARFNERMVTEGIPLVVKTGQEIRIHDDLLDAWGRQELLSLADSRYVLLEMPSSRIPSGIWDLLHELRLMGLTAIIAHPERNAEVARHPERLAALIEAGAYAQVTTHSLLGGFGSKIEQSSWSLCKQGLIHIVSSDAHHVELRGFRLQEAYRRIGQQLGGRFEEIFRQNATAVLYNDVIELVAKSTKNVSLWDKFSTLFRKC